MRKIIKTVMKTLFIHFFIQKTVLLYPIHMVKMTFCFVSIQMSGCTDFSYQGFMLENSTKEHRFVVALIGSKDPTKKRPTKHYYLLRHEDEYLLQCVFLRGMCVLLCCGMTRRKKQIQQNPASLTVSPHCCIIS